MFDLYLRLFSNLLKAEDSSSYKIKELMRTMSDKVYLGLEFERHTFIDKQFWI